MMMLMLNMLMAIIMDVYTEVKADAEEIPPVWTQLYSVLKERYDVHSGSVISGSELLEVLQEMPETELDEAILMKRVGPGLSKEQAETIIQDAKQNVENKLNNGVTMSEAMRMIGWVKIAVQKNRLEVGGGAGHGGGPARHHGRKNADSSQFAA